MFEKIKYNMAHFIIRKKYLPKKREPISFSGIISNSRNFFIVMPTDSKEFNQSLVVINLLIENQKEILILLHKNQQELLKESGKLKIISYTDESKNRLGLPLHSFIDQITGKKYDVVLNLNRDRDVFLNAVANSVNSNIRVGFENERTDNYYDIKFVPTSPKPEEIYQNYVNFLKMF